MAPRISTSPVLIVSAALASRSWPKPAACLRIRSSWSSGASSRPEVAASGTAAKHDQVAQPVQEVHSEPSRIVAGLDDMVDGQEDRGTVAGRESLGHLVEQRAVGVAEQRDRPVVAQSGLVRAGHELIEHRQRVPHRAGAGPDHDGQHRLARN